MSAVQLVCFSEGRETLRQSFLMSCFCPFDNSKAISADLILWPFLCFILYVLICPDVSAQLSELFLTNGS